MFVRVKSTPNSPRRSVQVVESSRMGDKVPRRIVRHIGNARDQPEQAKRLKSEALFALGAVRRARCRLVRRLLSPSLQNRK
jgi:hypothetical protein